MTLCCRYKDLRVLVIQRDTLSLIRSLTVQQSQTPVSDIGRLVDIRRLVYAVLGVYNGCVSWSNATVEDVTVTLS